jgi:cytochrome c
MKKIFIPLVALTVLIACNGGGTKDGPKEDKKESSGDISDNPDYKKGLSLIAQNDCLTCHKIDDVLTGPSYRDVANKYAGADTAVAYLSAKIISGGNGVWGSIPMTPHPGVTKEDAESMVKYILLLKK